MLIIIYLSLMNVQSCALAGDVMEICAHFYTSASVDLRNSNSGDNDRYVGTVKVIFFW